MRERSTSSSDFSKCKSPSIGGMVTLFNESAMRSRDAGISLAAAFISRAFSTACRSQVLARCSSDRASVAVTCNRACLRIKVFIDQSLADRRGVRFVLAGADGRVYRMESNRAVSRHQVLCQTYQFTGVRQRTAIRTRYSRTPYVSKILGAFCPRACV